MTYRLPALQPLWSFASAANLPHVITESAAATIGRHAVNGWSPDPDGRPRIRWAVGRLPSAAA